MNYEQTISLLEACNDNSSPLFFILGPCALENEKHARSIASFLKDLSVKLNFPLIFKSSFDKANRVSISSYRSVGMEEGCRILGRIRADFDIPVTTDIHEAWQAEMVAPFVDIIQIPAFLCRQTDLLVAAGKSGRIINIKKGQFASVGVMEHSAEKVKSTHNSKIWLCERGFSFGYGDLIVDFRNFPIMKSYGYPVVFDVTHSVQRPSSHGNSSGGNRLAVADLAIAGISQGIAGIFMEVHENPELALSDGPNSIRLSNLETLISYFMELDGWIKSHKKPHSF
jgi:2-dehydro-3-deoxyphosphooctonate aldolase (KDO 8-P synthase)